MIFSTISNVAGKYCIEGPSKEDLICLYRKQFIMPTVRFIKVPKRQFNNTQMKRKLQSIFI